MSHPLKQAGYDKIAEVKVERFHDQNGRVEYAHIAGITEDGDVFTVSIEHGDDEDALCAGLAARGYTNDRCVFGGIKPKHR